MADVNSKAEKIAAARKKLKEFQQKSHKPNKSSKTEINENIKNDESSNNDNESVVSSACDSINENSQVIDTCLYPPSVNIDLDSQNEWPLIQQHTDFHQFNTVNFSQPSDIGTVNASESIEKLNENHNVEYSLPANNVESISNNHAGLSEDISFFDRPLEPLKSDNEVDNNAASNTFVQNEINSYADSLQSYFTNPAQNNFNVNNKFSTQNFISVESADVVPTVDAQENSINSCEIKFDNHEQDAKNHPSTDKDYSNESVPEISLKSLNTNDSYKLSNAENIRQLSSQLQQFIDMDSTPVQSSTFQLEQRNQQLAALLEKEQLETQQLRATLDEFKNKIYQLENESKKMHSQYEIKLNDELNPLKEQLQYHVQTIGLLVGEKTELMSALEKSQSLAKEKVSECEELQGRLKASRYRVIDLEKELSTLKNSQSDVNANSQQLKQIESTKMENEMLKRQIDDIRQEKSELEQKYESRINENITLQQLLQDTSSQLSLSQLKVQQLATVENSDLEKQFETLNKDKIYLESKVTELTESLKSSNVERDKSSQQYQQYVMQLNGQMQNMSNQIETLTKENESLIKREKGLISHVSELEKEIQSIRNAKKNTPSVSISDVQALQTEIDSLKQSLESSTTAMKTFEEKNKHLEEQLIEKENKLLDLKNYVETIKEDTPNIAKLMQSIESDKVAAAQAIQQNSKLMQQIKELQDEFVKISNMKLELMQKLESEQHLGHEILQQLKNCEDELENMKDIVKTKDNRILELENKVYESDTITNTPIETNLETKDTVQTQVPNKNSKSNEESTNENNNEGTRFVEKSEAMRQLEERFTRTMKEVAELTEEKQRLEHLVLQLQDETETIGEYVALYQHQRGILKQRSIEKDEQLRILNNDREELKRKLNELNYYIREFVGSERSELIKQYEKLKDEQTETIDNAKQENNININSGVKDEAATKIIQLLSEINSSNLVEPKEVMGIEGFHPCPLCSGQLINV